MIRIDIPKEKIIELYTEKYLTTLEIAELYKVDRTTISNRLKEFGIAINPSQRKYRIIKTIPLTQQQKDFIVGTLLGDASVVISGRRKTAYFKVAHCKKHKAYLLWKKAMLGDLVSNVYKNVDKRGNSVMYNLYTLAHPEFNFFKELFYFNNEKVISEELEKFLTPLGLATWFMDDGGRSGRGCNYRISTEGFSEDENYKLQQILRVNFDLDVKVLKSRNYHYLFMNKENAIRMTEIIRPYIVDCMKYKLMIDRSSTTETQSS